MKLLVSTKSDELKTNETFAPEDEIVIPAFPAPPTNQFIAIPSFKFAKYAKIKIFKPEEEYKLAEAYKKLIEYYPGITPNILEAYLTIPNEKIQHLPENTEFYILVDYETATLVIKGDNIKEEERYIHLWEEHPK